MNAPALGAAAAATVLVIAHGAIGHGWHRAQLRGAAFTPTAIVGDADAARRFFHVTWHLVTVFFAATAVALGAIGAGAYTSAVVLRFISGTYAAVLAVCVVYFATRLRAVARPIPATASAAMVAVIVLSWLAA